MNQEHKQIKRVVVYRIGSLGDALVALPAFHLVRRAFPHAHITLLTNIPVNAKAAPMETVLRNTGLYNDTLKYPVSLRNFRELFRLRKALRDGQHDCLVYLASPKGGILTSLRDYIFFRSCAIRRVVGVPFSRSTLRSLPIAGTELYQSRTARSLEALQELGTAEVSAPEWWDLKLTSAEITEGEALLGAHGIKPPFLAASVGTKIQAKDWEERNWRELMQRVAPAFTELPLVMLGVEEERERSERLLKIWQGPKANLCGETSPRVSAAILRGAGVMLCHDSGPMHVAATMGVPCVAIFSARAKPGEWFPHGNQHSVLYHQTPCWDCGLETCIAQRKVCILSITVDEVFTALRQQLARKGIFSKHDFSSLRQEVTPPSAQQPARSKLRVLLIGNYAADRQESMQRFAGVMEKELTAAGLDVTLVRPEPIMGRLKPGATGLGKWLGYIDKFILFPILLRKKLLTLNAQLSTNLIVHICDHSNAIYTRNLQSVPHIVTCHDLLAVRSARGEFPEHPTRWSGRLLQRMTLRGLARARKIVCISEATRRDVTRLVAGAEARLPVINMGLNNDFAPAPAAQARARVQAMMQKAGQTLAERARYILHVGGGPWYKNRKGVVEIFCELRRASGNGNLCLVMVGEPLESELRTYLADDGLAGSVFECLGVSHADLCALYSAAELLLFPSLQEGFGWPIIEAQACGCRVVTTNRPPMTEVGGDAATYLDPDNLWSAVDILTNVLDADDATRNAMIRRGLANAARYSTQAMIDSYGETYMNVAETQA